MFAGTADNTRIEAKENLGGTFVADQKVSRLKTIAGFCPSGPNMSLDLSASFHT